MTPLNPLKSSALFPVHRVVSPDSAQAPFHGLVSPGSATPQVPLRYMGLIARKKGLPEVPCANLIPDPCHVTSEPPLHGVKCPKKVQTEMPHSNLIPDPRFMGLSHRKRFLTTKTRRHEGSSSFSRAQGAQAKQSSCPASCLCDFVVNGACAWVRSGQTAFAPGSWGCFAEKRICLRCSSKN